MKKNISIQMIAALACLTFGLNSMSDGLNFMSDEKLFENALLGKLSPKQCSLIPRLHLVNCLNLKFLKNYNSSKILQTLGQFKNITSLGLHKSFFEIDGFSLESLGELLTTKLNRISYLGLMSGGRICYLGNVSAFFNYLKQLEFLNDFTLNIQLENSDVQLFEDGFKELCFLNTTLDFIIEDSKGKQPSFLTWKKDCSLRGLCERFRTTNFIDFN